MESRGRKSAAELAIVPPVQTVQRPDAPYDLTDEQTDEWRAVVASLPADWFERGNYALLAQYCRHVVAARRIAQLIEQCASGEKLVIGDLCELLKRQEAESRAINALLRSMRLTQQSIMRAETAKRTPQVKKPWQT